MKLNLKYLTYLLFIIPYLFSSCGENPSNSYSKTENAFIKVKCKSVELAPSGKYRYTFTIKNFDPIKSKFNGVVTISIISQEEKSIRYDDFEFIDLYNGSNKDVIIEANTGLVEVHNTAGIYKYGYSITNNDYPNLKEGFNDIEEYKLDENYKIKEEYKLKKKKK